MRRQIIETITKENVWNIKDNESNQEKAKFLFQNGHNTATFKKNGQHIQAHTDQFRSRIEPEKIEMEEKWGNEEREQMISTMKQRRVWKKMTMNRLKRLSKKLNLDLDLP